MTLDSRDGTNHPKQTNKLGSTKLQGGITPEASLTSFAAGKFAVSKRYRAVGNDFEDKALRGHEELKRRHALA